MRSNQNSVIESHECANHLIVQALADPGEFLLSDFAKLDRSAQLHLGFQAIDAFQVRTPYIGAHVVGDLCCVCDFSRYITLYQLW